MAYAVKVLADSIGPSGCRLTTVEATYPRFVHSELMTHRMLSKNSASSRAIPVEKMLARVTSDPVVPVWWGKNQPGMQAREELPEAEKAEAAREWLAARDRAVEGARRLLELGGHKQIVNRIVEPWMWITVIISATEWENFFALRCHEDAQPEIRRIAEMIRAARAESVPRVLRAGGWHLPMVTERELDTVPTLDLIKVAVGRCARVSYLTHDGVRDLKADVELCNRLSKSGHWSPFEHVARALPTAERSGNFFGWWQYRKAFQTENAGRVMT